MSFITDLFSSGASSLVDSVGNAIDKNTTTTAERMALTNEERKAEYQYNIDNRKIDLEETKAFLVDVADSRNMNVKIQESDRASFMSKNLPYFIDIFILLIWGFMTIYLTLKWLGLIVVAPNVDMTGILGIYTGITGLAVMIIQFHRGSSQGSKDKTEAINKNLSK